MRVYKALLLNELIILKRFAFWLPIFELIAVGFVFAPYVNRYDPSGIRYPESIAPVIAFCGCMIGVAMFACVNASQSAAFEKTEGMNYFLFSQNINKLIYILAKATVPVILSFIGEILPVSVFYLSGLYAPDSRLGVGLLMLSILGVCLIWTLISILCSIYIKEVANMGMTSFGLTAAVLVGLGAVILNCTNIIIPIMMLLSMVLLLFLLAYYALKKKEEVISFERID